MRRWIGEARWAARPTSWGSRRGSAAPGRWRRRWRQHGPAHPLMTAMRCNILYGRPRCAATRLQSEKLKKTRRRRSTQEPGPLQTGSAANTPWARVERLRPRAPPGHLPGSCLPGTKKKKRDLAPPCTCRAWAGPKEKFFNEKISHISPYKPI